MKGNKMAEDTNTNQSVVEIAPYPFYMFCVKTNKATHTGGTMIPVDVDDDSFNKMVEQLKKEAAHIASYNKEKFISLTIIDADGVVKEISSLDENAEKKEA
jgi:hypothetical protein